MSKSVTICCKLNNALYFGRETGPLPAIPNLVLRVNDQTLTLVCWGFGGIFHTKLFHKTFSGHLHPLPNVLVVWGKIGTSRHIKRVGITPNMWPLWVHVATCDKETHVTCHATSSHIRDMCRWVHVTTCGKETHHTSHVKHDTCAMCQWLPVHPSQKCGTTAPHV